tara:strand:+ start:3171 stop:4052 length:882 start_codon:yes stop_codon:yes gene_type:complete
MELSVILFIIIIGFLTGILASLIGIGGGLIIVPSMIFFFNLLPSQATLISSFVIIFISFSSSYKNYKLKRIDYETALTFFVICIPGSILGGLTSEIINPQFLKFIFGITLIIYSIRGFYKSIKNIKSDRINNTTSKINNNDNLVLSNNSSDHIFNRHIVDSDGSEYKYNVEFGSEMIIIFIGGYFAGLLGLGGGIIFVPLLYNFLGLPFIIVVATSMFVIFLNSIIIVSSRIIFQIINSELDYSILLDFGLPLSIASIIGAYFGSSLTKKIGPNYLSIIFWLIAIFASFRMMI